MFCEFFPFFFPTQALFFYFFVFSFSPTPTTLEQAYAELLELYSVTEFLYQTLKEQSTVYTGALVDGPVVLPDDTLTLVTEFTE